MDGINNPFTKWCVDQGLTEDDVSCDTLVTAINYLLNDAAVQKRGEQFDPKQLLRSRLDKINKPELISIVQNFAWFSHHVVKQYVTSTAATAVQWSTELEKWRNRANDLKDQQNLLTAELEEAREKLNTFQGKVISLHEELLVEKNRTIEKLVGSVQSTVKEELQSYATVVKNSCSASLAPAKIQAAMRKVSTEEDRSRNLIVYGLDEDADENTEEAALTVIQYTGEKPKLVACRRLGERTGDKGRPIKVTFQSGEMARSVLAKSANLRQVEGYSRVYLGPDRTFEQRKERKRLLGVLCEKRASCPEKKFVIRRGAVTELD